ncbi:MAG: FG-GAP-like repeat-containing protein [Myxococcaceae bacterium]
MDFVCTEPTTPPPSCPEGHSWEPLLEVCAPPVEVGECLQAPAASQTPEVLWHHAAEDDFDQSISTPVVVDVNGDGAADVLATFFTAETGVEGPAIIRALSGLDGRQLWKTPLDAQHGPAGAAQLAVARLVENRPLTVLAAERDGTLAAFDATTGARLWRTRTSSGSPAPCQIGWGAPLVANLDGVGTPEIVCSLTVFDAHGVLRWSAEGGTDAPWGAMVAAGDLDGDGTLEITDGRHAYRHDGSLYWKVAEGGGGLAGIADFLRSPWDLAPDGVPEVVLIRDGRIELLEGRTGQRLVGPTNLPSSINSFCYSREQVVPGRGGPPAIADLDGDGSPEVVVASGECIAAMSLTRDSGPAQWTMRWGMTAVDRSSSTTAAALFDFDADGTLDVVYAGETKLHFLRGDLGTPSFEPLSHCSGTLYESPVVADVDGDGSANVVVAVNTHQADALWCSFNVRPGITVYRELEGRWANARGIWNQHGYHPSGVCDGHDAVCESSGTSNDPGNIPRVFPEPYSPEHNVMRANSHGPWAPLGVPNLRITHVVASALLCPEEESVMVRVVNTGQAPARAGTPMTLWRDEAVLAQGVLSVPLRPGQAVVVTLRFSPSETTRSPDAVVRVGPPPGQSECDPGDNAFPVRLPGCSPAIRDEG